MRRFFNANIGLNSQALEQHLRKKKATVDGKEPLSTLTFQQLVKSNVTAKHEVLADRKQIGDTHPTTGWLTPEQRDNANNKEVPQRARGDKPVHLEKFLICVNICLQLFPVSAE